MSDAEVAQPREVPSHFDGGPHQRAAGLRIWLVEQDRKRAQHDFHSGSTSRVRRLAKLTDHLIEPIETWNSSRVPAVAELHRAIECVLPESGNVDRRVRL